MDEQNNYLGATIFWLYIIAALAFTSIILKTIHDLHANNETKHHGRRKNIVLFSTLAALSFATLSYNMLNVLIQSYTLWARERHMSLADTSLRTIWHWSITSTLFQDFGNAIVQSSARYLWVEASLLATLCVCLHVGIEGQHRRVPRLWAFVGLSQILPVSFTQNLFYIALLQRPQAQQQWLVPRKAVVLLSGAYCACLIVAPILAGTEWLIPHILLARSILVAMQVLPWGGSEGQKDSVSTANDEHLDAAGVVGILTLLTTLCGFAQVSLAFLEAAPMDVGKALFSHPAVSSLGCDFMLSGISYLCWRSIDIPDTISQSKAAAK